MSAPPEPRGRTWQGHAEPAAGRGPGSPGGVAPRWPAPGSAAEAPRGPRSPGASPAGQATEPPPLGPEAQAGPECCGRASDTGVMTVPSPVPPPGVPGERLLVRLSPAEKDGGHRSHRGPAPHCVDGETEGPGRGTSVRSPQLCSFSSGAGKFGRLQGWLRRVFCRLRIHPGIPRKPQQTWVFCFVSFCFVFCCQRKVLWTFCINRTRNSFKTFVFN